MLQPFLNLIILILVVASLPCRDNIKTTYTSTPTLFSPHQNSRSLSSSQHSHSFRRILTLTSSYTANHGIRIPQPGLKHHPSSLNHHTSTTSTSGESLRLHHDDKPAHIKPQYENKLTKRSHTTTTRTTTTKWQASATQLSGNASPSPYTWTKTKPRSKALNTRTSASPCIHNSIR